MPSTCVKKLMNLRQRLQILMEGARDKCATAGMVIMCAVMALFVVLMIMGIIIIAVPSVSEDPLNSTLLDSLALDIPSDGHYTYICLHDGKTWSDCVQIMQRGNVTLTITAERTKSETGHHLVITTGLINILVCGLVLVVVGILALGMCCWRVCCDCFWLQIICPKSISTRIAKYTSNINEDLEFCVRETPTARGFIRSRYQVQSLEETQDWGINPPEAIPGPMLDNPCFEDSETIHERKASKRKRKSSSSVQKDNQTSLELKTEKRFKSSNFVQKENKTSLKLKTEKRIDSHNGSPQFIQAISDKMVDIENQVDANALIESVIPKKYDCFIIYSGHNDDFVHTSIIPHLEELNITYCEHQQHFIPGRDIFTNIQDCISESSKILAVLSADFFDSGWCCKDLDMAMAHAAERQIESFIVPIKIDDCVIPDKYGDLKEITYSDLTNSPSDWGVWEQIRSSLASIHVATIKLEIHMCPKSLQKAYNISTENTWL